MPVERERKRPWICWWREFARVKYSRLFASSRRSLAPPAALSPNHGEVSAVHASSNPFACPATVWAAIFAALHVIWAIGWPVGLDEEKMREAFQRPWFLAYDLAVAAVCVLGAVVALAFVRPWGRRLSRRLISALAWSGTSVLVLRGGAGLAQLAYYAATVRKVPARTTFWEFWFALGAVRGSRIGG